jgi:hypothetical protein
VRWNDQIVFREHLRFHDMTGSRRLCNLSKLNLLDLQPNLDLSFQGTASDEQKLSSELKLHALGKANVKRAVTRVQVPMAASLGLSHTDTDDTAGNADTWQAPVQIVGDISGEELARLEKSDDRINLVISWLYELVTDIVPSVAVPPPIISRVYQELSNGALGYSQAEKLADVPFPFIFAQCLALSLVIFTLVAPIAFADLAGNSKLNPVISSFVIVLFWSLNEMAKELENPFGIEANNVPVGDYHERFVFFLGQTHHNMLPRDRVQGSPMAESRVA